MHARKSCWYLCGVTDSAGPPWVIPIDNSSFVIGRRPGVSLKLDSCYVSGRHAELAIRGDRLFVTDLGSQNGVYVNGERVRSGQLGLGDLLTVGDVHFRVRRESVERNSVRSSDVECGRCGELSGTRNRYGMNSGLPPDGDHGEQDGLAELHLEWLAGQLDRLLREGSAFPVLRPVYGLREGELVGYNVTAGSQIAGLETEAKVLKAATQLGRESDVNRELIAWCGAAVELVEDRSWVCLHAPPAVNTELELLPALMSLRANHPLTPIIVAFRDLPGRSLRTLKNLAAVLGDLSIDLGMTEFHHDQLRFLQTANLKVRYVRLDGALAGELFGESEAHRARVRSLAELLRHNRVRLAVDGVDGEPQLETCRELGIDFASGPLLDRAQPFPETGVMTSSHVMRMFADEALMRDTPVSDILAECVDTGG